MLVWSALGFKLAFTKGQMGTTITWVGATITIEEGGIRAKVKQSIIEDILVDLEKFKSQNVITKKTCTRFWANLATYLDYWL